jgi:hypothetical protein
MAEKEQAGKSESAGGTNWYFGADKLLSPSLELLGNKLRDGLKAYLNKKSREKEQLAKAQRKFLERQVIVLKFSHVQLVHVVEFFEKHILSTELPRAAVILRETVQGNQLSDYEAVFQAVMNGVRRDPAPDSPPLKIIYEVASGIIDWLVLIQSMKLMALVIQVPSAIHTETPDVTNAELDKIFRSEGTMLELQELVPEPSIDLPAWLQKTLSDCYGVGPQELEK